MSHPSSQAKHDEAIMQEKNEHFLKLCYETFEKNESGKELLGILKESLLEMSPAADPNKEASHAYFREGQNHLVRSIIANIKQFKERGKRG